MSSKNRDLQKIAATVIDLAVNRDWRPTTYDIQKKFKLNEPQVQLVKRYAKKEAVLRGMLWAWHPLTGKFRLCPDNAPEIANDMVSYAYTAWSRSGGANNYLIQGAEAKGYIGRTESSRVQKKTEKIAHDIRLLGGSIRTTEQGDDE